MLPRHVHILIDSLRVGGAENLLAQQAAGLRDRDIEVTVSSLTGEAEEIERSAVARAGFEPKLIGTSGLLGYQDRGKMRAHLTAVGADIVHSHLGYADMLGGLAARRLQLCAVSTLHVTEWGHTGADRIKDQLMARTRRRGMQRVIAVSDAVRDAYLNRGWETQDRVLTVHNGIDFESRPGSGAELRRELGIPEATKVIGMITVLREGKGHELAAQAVQELADSGEADDLCLLVAGDGPNREGVERALEPLGDRARLIGHRDDVAPALDAADLFVHPSLGEALPTAVLEAMAAGTPVLATRVGGVPELISDGETGLLIPEPEVRPLVAALRSLLAEPEHAAGLAEAARQRYQERFTVSAWMDRLLPAYEEAFAAHSSS